MNNCLVIVVVILITTTNIAYSQSMFADNGEFGLAAIGFLDSSAELGYGASATIGGIIEIGVAKSKKLEMAYTSVRLLSKKKVKGFLNAGVAIGSNNNLFLFGFSIAPKYELSGGVSFFPTFELTIPSVNPHNFIASLDFSILFAKIVVVSPSIS